MDSAGFGTRVFGRAACGSDAICWCGRITNWSRVTGSGVAADHQRSRWLGGTRIPLPRRTRRWIQQVSGPPCSLGRRAGRMPFAGCGRIANWSRVTGSGVAADHQRSRWLGGTRIPLPRRGGDGFSRFRDHRVRSGGVRVGCHFLDAAASRIGPGSPGRVSRLITSAVGGLVARGSRCRVGPGRWIQQVSGPPCSVGRRAGRCHLPMRPHRELVPGHRVGCRG
jgi:ribosome modulation factor